jgi:hypothetical protein
MLRLGRAGRRGSGRSNVASDKSRRRAKAEKAGAGVTPPVDPKDALGGELRAMFDTVASAPMPDRLAALVDELEEKHARGELAPKN